MGQKPQILVDTDILIKVFRGDAKKKRLLDNNKDRLAVSVVTYFELLAGLKTRRRIIDLNKQMKAYFLIHVSEQISKRALSIFQTYAVKHTLNAGDSLIAATALESGIEIFTDNISDFDFIKGIKIFKQV